MAAQQRLGIAQNSSCDPDLVEFLNEWFAQNNPYAPSFKMMNEVERAEEEAAIRDNCRPTTIRMVFEENGGSNIARGKYALSTAKFAVVYVREESDVPLARSLAVFLRESDGTSLLNISDIGKRCDFLAYPLLFLNGRGGWDTTLVDKRGDRTTQMKYYSYLVVRDSFNAVLHLGKLFQQFAVDAYVKIEQNRLNYHRTHQVNLRSDSYRDWLFTYLDIRQFADLVQIVVPPVNQMPSLPHVPVDYRQHESEGSRLYE
ncbi:hypothetical protein NECAME_06382 [Necator americanus]|uniref:Helitron helicase-like domain-containing protein n=1 Tax=Necator americanus TaxID=51031 RepID=W2TUW1_NECAM|nr:hypothetical protein NECAME_06382 [Necator americanus]ETN85429.1 hypothetical protein NECAME_06382 [Necator americanus]